jgi:hypothetical protein
MYIGKIYVPKYKEIKNMVLREIHNVPYTGHASYQKIITAVKNQYFWHGMKKNMVDYIVKCLECQKVKVKHKHTNGFI